MNDEINIFHVARSIICFIFRYVDFYRTLNYFFISNLFSEMIPIQILATSGPEVFDFQVTGLQALIRAARRE